MFLMLALSLPSVTDYLPYMAGHIKLADDFRPEDEDSLFLENVGICLNVHTVF
jgi:hypothetical protein